jgi:plasmid stabilization system protein ParE
VLRVEVTRRAAAQIALAAEWWKDNRPSAPNAIAEDFEQAKNLLAQQPGIGARSSSPHYPDLRRLYLSRVRYHVYYYANAEAVVILAFWHASREAGPLL